MSDKIALNQPICTFPGSAEKANAIATFLNGLDFQSTFLLEEFEDSWTIMYARKVRESIGADISTLIEILAGTVDESGVECLAATPPVEPRVEAPADLAYTPPIDPMPTSTFGDPE